MLLTSHYLEEVEALAQRVVVIGSGRVLAHGELSEVRGIVACSVVSLRATTLPELPGRLPRCDVVGYPRACTVPAASRS